MPAIDLYENLHTLESPTKIQCRQQCGAQKPQTNRRNNKSFFIIKLCRFVCLLLSVFFFILCTSIVSVADSGEINGTFFFVEIFDFSLRAIDICFNAAVQSLVWCCLSIFTFGMNRIKRIAANVVWPLIYPLCLRYIIPYCEWWRLNDCHGWIDCSFRHSWETGKEIDFSP